MVKKVNRNKREFEACDYKYGVCFIKKSVREKTTSDFMHVLEECPGLCGLRYSLQEFENLDYL